MTTAQVVETSVTVNNDSPIQDYIHPDDQTQPTFDIGYLGLQTSSPGVGGEGGTRVSLGYLNVTLLSYCLFFLRIASQKFNLKSSRNVLL